MICITMARRPLASSTVAENTLAHDLGGLNVDGSRIAPTGRWPANLVLSPAGATDMDLQSGETTSSPNEVRTGQPWAGLSGLGSFTMSVGSTHKDRGGASRFFKKVGVP